MEKNRMRWTWDEWDKKIYETKYIIIFKYTFGGNIYTMEKNEGKEVKKIMIFLKS